MDDSKIETIFTSEQRNLVISIVDCIIPVSDDMPSAGSVGVDLWIETRLLSDTSARREFLDGLTQLQIYSNNHYSSFFEELSDFEKENVLVYIEKVFPVFFAFLVRQTFNGYYICPDVQKLLSNHSQAPQPIGYELEAWELGKLKNVLNRGQKFRQT